MGTGHTKRRRAHGPSVVVELSQIAATMVITLTTSILINISQGSLYNTPPVSLTLINSTHFTLFACITPGTLSTISDTIGSIIQTLNQPLALTQTITFL